MRILLVQMNPIVGDLIGNTKRIIQAIQQGQNQRVDLVVFPEMALSGYPPEDFVLLPHFIESVAQHLQKIVQATQGIAAIVGFPRRNPHKLEKSLYNSAAFIQNQTLVDIADKILLPTYDVFDERRYFEPGHQVKIWTLNHHQLAITICEDLWQHSGFLCSTHYRRDPIVEIQAQRPSCLINISASPYSLNKLDTRLNVCLSAARSLNCPVILCNQVGGNDSLVFDGYSLHVTQDGILQYARGFEEDEMLIDFEDARQPIKMEYHLLHDLYQALILGTRDYFRKTGFKKACLGLSGGIDSAVVACIAAAALGPQNVLAISMPSRYSSVESSRDAALLSQHIGIEHREISIEDCYESFLCTLAPDFKDQPLDVTEENLQARIRGIILMSFSNKFGYLVLSTGNKSELALGYSTLYGDMCGGLAVIGDLSKQQVYSLAHWINQEQRIIPQYTLERAPSAELRPNQKDSDTLPDYEVIDRILKAYVEEHRSPEWIANHFQYSFALVQDLVRRIHLNEYKRRQSPPSLRVSEKSFSVGRRFPIAQRWT